jgi:hypothetical protein
LPLYAILIATSCIASYLCRHVSQNEARLMRDRIKYLLDPRWDTAAEMESMNCELLGCQLSLSGAYFSLDSSSESWTIERACLTGGEAVGVVLCTERQKWFSYCGGRKEGTSRQERRHYTAGCSDCHLCLPSLC